MGGYFEEIGQNFLSEPPTQEKFSKNGLKVYPSAQSVPQALKWEIDGVEWEYIPVEESE
jgi:hypothetical protein